MLRLLSSSLVSSSVAKRASGKKKVVEQGRKSKIPGILVLLLISAMFLMLLYIGLTERNGSFVFMSAAFFGLMGYRRRFCIVNHLVDWLRKRELLSEHMTITYEWKGRASEL